MKAVSKKGKDAVASEHQSLWEISAPLINGEVTNLGKVCDAKKATLVVNVASK